MKSAEIISAIASRVIILGGTTVTFDGNFFLAKGLSLVHIGPNKLAFCNWEHRFEGAPIVEIDLHAFSEAFQYNVLCYYRAAIREQLTEKAQEIIFEGIPEVPETTVTIFSLAEHEMVLNTIYNAIRWTPFKSMMRTEGTLRAEDPAENKSREEELYQRIRAERIHFKIENLYRIIYKELPQYEIERIYAADNTLRRLLLNDIPFTLVDSEAMQEDLETLLRNTPPLYQKILPHVRKQ